GADFSGADIRSTSFINSILQETKFCYVLAGRQYQWQLTNWLILTGFMFFAGSLQGYGGGVLGHYFVLSQNNPLLLIAASMGLVAVAASSIFVLRQGLTIRALGSVVIVITLSGSTTALISFLSNTTGAFAYAGAVAAVGIISGGCIGAIVLLGHNPFCYLAVFSIALVSAALSSPFNYIGYEAVFFAVLTSTIAALFSIPIHRLVLNEDPRFMNFRIICLAFITLGGTSFSGADLADSTFAHARLKYTTLASPRQKATHLRHIRWHNVRYLEFVRLGATHFWQYNQSGVGISALQDRETRRLLVTLNGVDQNFSGADLRDVNLNGAQLHRIDLKGANLSGATLVGAELQGANLAEANCIGTNFTAAHLTGASLEAWNIDSTTLLKDIDCQYVFLREQPDARGSRERRPHDPDKIFQPGDFEKFFREMLDTVQILIRNGVDPQAFRTAFEKVMAEYPSINRNSIQAMEKQGSDVLLTLQVPEGTDKGKLERTWDDGYQLGLKEGYTSGLLEGQKQRADDVKEVALSFSRFFSPIHINNMNNPINTGDGSFYAGGDVNLSGSTLNLGQISGQVTNQINQIPAPAAPGQPDLRDILTQLQTAAETDSELSDDEKAEALQAVSRIATAATAPNNPDDKTKGMVKRATATLKGMTETLTDASKLAEACQKLLPLVLSMFALI
ncbi:MAG: pentapeptide repeat-containing protein, partial [Leptolyngbya sp. LCM1.Bin17]